MEAFWRQARQAALRIWRRGEELGCEPNAAALQWARDQGLQEATDLHRRWQALAQHVLVAPDDLPRPWRLGEDGPLFEGQAIAGGRDDVLLWWCGDAAAADRIQLEQVLKLGGLSAEREPTLFALSAAGVGVWRRQDGRATYWSPSMYRLRGLDPSDERPVAQLFELCLHPDERAAWEQVRLSYTDGGSELHEWEFRVVWPDGSVHWLLSRGRSVRDAQDRVLYTTGINVDATARHRTQILQLGRERLEQAKRTQSEFLARVSHELRTPMNAVLGFAQLMAYDSGDPLTARQAERLARIDTAGRHLLALIDDVLDLARLDADQQPLANEAVPLDALVREALDWVSAQALAAGVSLRLARPRLPGRVRGDRRRIGQILVNLLTNAIKYNRAQGYVEVDTRGAMQNWAEAASPQWALLVRDSGRGMEPQALQRIFEPFNRLGAELEGIAGTGIGLAIVKQLTERMGGHIEVDSVPGQGSEFRIWLPADEEETQPAPLDELPALAAQRHTPRGSGPLKLLCIEDNPTNLLLVRELMALRPQFEFSGASDGAGGLQLARKLRPDIVLLDLELPDIHGSAVLAGLRADPALTGCTVIALSANALPNDVQTGLAQGFDDYWTKPLEMARFLRRLDALLHAH